MMSMNRWIGKVAIVTGASVGIGAGIAKKLAEEGLIVVGLARRAALVEQLSKVLSNPKGVLHARSCDVSKESDILDAFKFVEDNLGPVHVLVNNAGVASTRFLIDGDTEQWKNILDVNVIALSIASREAIRDMRKNNVNGHIIHINSIAGHQVLHNYPLHMYGASKYAVTCLAKTLRLELNRLNSKIKITNLSPGLVKTDVFENTQHKVDFGVTPYLTAEDVANSVVYALSTPPNVQVEELTIRPINEAL